MISVSDKALERLRPGSRVLVAMSGGVDSSVAAYRLLRAGMEVTGCTMRLVSSGNCSSEDTEVKGEKTCCSIEAARIARKTANKLGIRHVVLDLKDDFYKYVIEPSRMEYLKGRTPNPCILCNRYIKFKILLDSAIDAGCTYIATGHYARIIEDGTGLHLYRGIDVEKDQSYFLAYLTEGEMANVIFPLGWDKKETIREEAKNAGLEAADRFESQDLCFTLMSSALKGSRAGESGHSGEIVTTGGKVIGYHNGVENYTIGQRKGLPGGQLTPIYVLDIDPTTNRIIVGNDMDSAASKFQIEDVSLVSRARDLARLDEAVEIQVRYRTKPVKGYVKISGVEGQVELEEPVRAITPGQVAVWYLNSEVCGAGIIRKVMK